MWWYDWRRNELWLSLCTRRWCLDFTNTWCKEYTDITLAIILSRCLGQRCYYWYWTTITTYWWRCTRGFADARRSRWYTGYGTRQFAWLTETRSGWLAAGWCVCCKENGCQNGSYCQRPGTVDLLYNEQYPVVQWQDLLDNEQYPVLRPDRPEQQSQRPEKDYW